MKKNILGLAVIVAIVWSSCVEPPDYPDEPVVTFVKFDKDTVRQSADTNVITVAFTDGNGDLGAVDSDTLPNLFLTDITRGDLYEYRIPFISTQGIGNGISGEIELTLLPSDICCDSVTLPCFPEAGALNEYAVYEVVIEDRAGNRSAPVKLPPFILLCDQ